MSTVTFVSKGLNFRAVTKPGLRYRDSHDELVVRPEEVIEFGPTGGKVTLNEDTDAKLIEHLRGLRSLNTEFWEVGNEPDAMHPTLDEQTAKIMDMAVSLDIDGLQELLEEEQASHNRLNVTTAANSALESAKATREKIEAKMAAAESEPSKA